MVGPTLNDIREHIEALATEDGTYYVRCGRLGDRPVPAAGNRFPDRATARAAARATAQYRAALRRYDPQVPHYDLIVCQETALDPDLTGRRDSTTEEPWGEQGIADSPTADRHELVEFCHRVAGAVFETLSETGYEDVERAVMDAYFEFAEAVEDHDELCLCLLECMSTELDERLCLADQAEVLANAADRLEPSGDDDPFDGTLAALERRGVIDGFTRSPYSVGFDGGVGAVVVQVSGYALSARDGRLPVLPVTLELCRRHPERPPQPVSVTAVDGGWQFTFVQSDTPGRNGFASAPVDGGS